MNKSSFLNKLKKIACSMRTALILLGCLLVICLIGSVLPQNKDVSTYIEAYGERAGYSIMALGFDHIFTAWYTAVIAVALCLNLIFCNLVRMRVLVKKWKSYQSGGRSHSPKPTACITEFQRTEFLEKCKGFTFLPEDENGIYGYRNRIGIWGAWVTHLGILVLILGFIITQTCSYQSYLYGTETTIRQLENTDYQVHIDAFTVTYRDDYTVDSYTTELSVLDENGVVLSKGSTSVNHPFVYKGYRFYQNSTGYACTLELFENDEFQNSEEIYAGTSVSIEALDVTIALNNLYPDYQMENGQPQTISPYLNNPYALYTLYYNDNILDMNVAAMGERLKFGVIEADFTDPKQYSMLEVRKDPALSVVLAGAILIMIGLFLSFYFRTEEIWIQKLRKDAPEDTNALEDTLENKMQWGIFCYSSKAQLLLEEKISDLLSDKEETNESE